MPIPSSEFIELRNEYTKLYRIIDVAILAQAKEDKTGVVVSVPQISNNLKTLIESCYTEIGWRVSFQIRYGDKNVPLTLITLIAVNGYVHKENTQSEEQNP